MSPLHHLRAHIHDQRSELLRKSARTHAHERKHTHTHIFTHARTHATHTHKHTTQTRTHTLTHTRTHTVMQVANRLKEGSNLRILRLSDNCIDQGT